MDQAAPVRRSDGNLLLATLPAAEYELLTAHLEPVVLRPRQALYAPDQLIDYVYFPDSGMVSLLAVLSDRTGVEAASTGRDGMVGMPVFHGADRMAVHAVVQVEGTARRMAVGQFRAAIAASKALDNVLHLYAACIFMMTAQSIACMSRHDIDRRLARWLLHTTDQGGGTKIGLTHDFLAQMLGVRRSSVTLAAGSLRKAGLIEYTKKRVTILDRAGLEGAACECYRIIRSTHDRLLYGSIPANPTAHVEFPRGGMRTVEGHRDVA